MLTDQWLWIADISSRAAPGDYTTQSSVSVTFLPSETEKVVTVNIVDDTVVEDTEVFLGILMAVDTSAVNITQAMAMVSITDNDGEYEN